MKILILSSERDKDAQIVKRGLASLGYAATILDWERYPANQQSSLEISPDAPNRLAFVDSGPIEAPFDVIWNRRPAQPRPNAPPESADYQIIHTQSSHYLRNVAALLGHEKTLWVNPLASAQRAEQKVLQLTQAKAVGFTIPKTLISNDFDKVKAFFHALGGDIIYKAFTTGKWHNPDGSTTVLRTALVTEANLTQPEVIRACPGIYQEHIKKAYELRVNVIGKVVLAGKIDSQAKEKCVDWRYDGRLMGIKLTAIDLPEHICALSIQLCQKLGLVFGCLDLIVDDQGRYIFLEVNQAGHFLWNESLAPQLPLLDTFCRFLATAGEQGVTLPTPPLALKNFVAGT